jgi:hypothetical protein
VTLPAEDDPVTLREACDIVFRGTITPATLRSESRRGKLTIRRIGRVDFVTLRAVRKLMGEDECQDDANRHGSTGEPTKASGSSEMERSRNAQAAAMATAQALKKHSRTTSQRSSPPPSASIHRLDLPSRKS